MRPISEARMVARTQAEALAYGPLWRGRLAGSPNVRLPYPIAGFRAQGRFSQLSAMSGLMHRSKTGPYSMTSSARS
jgi:hypothetical protein